MLISLVKVYKSVQVIISLSQKSPGQEVLWLSWWLDSVEWSLFPRRTTWAKAEVGLFHLYCHPKWINPYPFTVTESRCCSLLSSPLKKNCLVMGANLASVHSSTEYHGIQHLIVTASHDYQETWIGGSDAQEVLCLACFYLSMSEWIRNRSFLLC